MSPLAQGLNYRSACDRCVVVCIGAVCFGLDPTVVSVRKSRLTYGVGVMNRFLRGVHPDSKLVRRRDVDWCRDVFDRFVVADRPVALGDTVLRRYTPAEPDQTAIVMHIYSSENSDVRFVTDDGVQVINALTIYTHRKVQESAAYATVSARQGRHLANTFEVAAIECLTWVAT